MIVSGKAEVWVEPSAQPWDLCPLKVLVEEAGGMVTDIDGNSQRYDQPIRGALMSNKRAHDDLVELVKPHLLKAGRNS